MKRSKLTGTIIKAHQGHFLSRERKKKPKKTLSLEPEGIHAKTAQRLSKRGLRPRNLSQAGMDGPDVPGGASNEASKNGEKVPRERKRRSLSPKVSLESNAVAPRTLSKISKPKNVLSFPIETSD